MWGKATHAQVWGCVRNTHLGTWGHVAAAIQTYDTQQSPASCSPRILPTEPESPARGHGDRDAHGPTTPPGLGEEQTAPRTADFYKTSRDAVPWRTRCRTGSYFCKNGI